MQRAGGQQDRGAAQHGPAFEADGLDPGRIIGRADESAHGPAGQDRQVAAAAHRPKKGCFAVGLEVGNRGETVEMPRFQGIAQDVGRQAQRHRLVMPGRRTPAEAAGNPLQIGLAGKAAHSRAGVRPVRRTGRKSSYVIGHSGH